MRQLLFIALTGLFVLGTTGRSVAQDDPKEIIKKAIAAQGGAEKIDKFKGSRSSTKGTIAIMGLELEFTADSIGQLPDKQKTTIKLEVMGQAITLVQMVNGDKISMVVNGMDMPVPDAQKEDIKQSVAMQQVTSLTPLLSNAGFELKANPGEKVNGKDTLSVVVSGNGLKDAKLFFDKETNLLVKIERTASDPMGGGAMVKQEVYLSDYKDVQGIKRAMKSVMHNDGNKFMESVTTKLELAEKIDEKEFAD